MIAEREPTSDRRNHDEDAAKVAALVGGAAVLAAAAGLLWFAHARGWLAPAETWATGLFHRKEAGGTDTSGMNMPGMNMPGVSTGQTSAVPGYTEVTIPYEVQQRIGVTLGTVEKAPLEMTVRTVGIVQPDETKIDHVHLKTEGWITKLFVDYTGQDVNKDEKLLAIYSPDFVTTQQTISGRQQDPASRGRSRPRSGWSCGTCRPTRSRSWRAAARSTTDLTLRSPLTGTVLTKSAFAGQYVMPEKDLYVVADLSTVWVQAKVYEYELPHVVLDQPASVTLPAFPGRRSSQARSPSSSPPWTRPRGRSKCGSSCRTPKGCSSRACTPTSSSGTRWGRACSCRIRPSSAAASATSSSRLSRETASCRRRSRSARWDSTIASRSWKAWWRATGCPLRPTS